MTRAADLAYDVAFSFLAVDEALARRFADALQPLKSFVYSREQEKLAGSDGLASFRGAFRDESRLNVILYRAGWGDTKFTRIEETAIEERVHADGWDTLLVVRRDKSPKRPWMPDMRIYFEMDTFPFEQAVGAIKHKATQLGSDVRPLTGLERAQREAQAAEYDRETREFLGSDTGVRAADADVSVMFDALERDLAVLRSTVPRWAGEFGRAGCSHAVARLGECSVAINWKRSSNTLEGSRFTATVFDRHIPLPQDAASGKLYGYTGTPEQLAELSFKVDRRPGLDICWQESGSSSWLSSEEVAGKILERLTRFARHRDAVGRRS